MKSLQLRLLVFIIPLTAFAADSPSSEDMPKGEITKYSFDNSKIFPGTVRDYWIYVPKQYSPDKPACVYIGQDGIGFNAPAVFDRLIHNKEMPVTIGVLSCTGASKRRRTRHWIVSIAVTNTTVSATIMRGSC